MNSRREVDPGTEINSMNFGIVVLIVKNVTHFHKARVTSFKGHKYPGLFFEIFFEMVSW